MPVFFDFGGQSRQRVDQMADLQFVHDLLLLHQLLFHQLLLRRKLGLESGNLLRAAGGVGRRASGDGRPSIDNDAHLIQIGRVGAIRLSDGDQSEKSHAHARARSVHLIAAHFVAQAAHGLDRVHADAGRPGEASIAAQTSKDERSGAPTSQ